MNSKTATVRTSSGRDDYGRRVQTTTVNGRAVCVRVTIPKHAQAQLGFVYFVNDFANDFEITECAGLAEARATVTAIVSREVKAATD